MRRFPWHNSDIAQKYPPTVNPVNRQSHATPPKRLRPVGIRALIRNSQRARHEISHNPHEPRNEMAPFTPNSAIVSKNVSTLLLLLFKISSALQ